MLIGTGILSIKLILSTFGRVNLSDRYSSGITDTINFLNECWAQKAMDESEGNMEGL